MENQLITTTDCLRERNAGTSSCPEAGIDCFLWLKGDAALLFLVIRWWAAKMVRKVIKKLCPVWVTEQDSSHLPAIHRQRA
jgi:hypothetical protein